MTTDTRERIKQFVKRPETRRWIADKVGGALLGHVIVISIIFVIDHADGEAELIAALISLLAE